jgi:hypothetical protein
MGADMHTIFCIFVGEAHRVKLVEGDNLEMLVTGSESVLLQIL